MDPPSSLRDRKRAATRHRLMHAALQLFAERGFDGTTVDDIATHADVARRTFFRYFPTKVDVLFADHVERLALLRDTLATRDPGESVLDAVRRATLEGVDEVIADPELYLTRSTLVTSIPDARARDRVLDTDYENLIAIADASTRHADPATDLQARLLAKAAWAATRSARELWVHSRARLDPRQLVDEAFNLLRRGFV